MKNHSLRIPGLFVAFAVLLVGCGTTGDVVREAEPVDPAAFVASVLEGDAMAVERHIDNGADVNARDELERTPLIRAAALGHVEVARLLITNGANVGSRNNCGQTALMFASQYGHPNFVIILIEAGADVNAQADDGATALFFASRFSHPSIAEMLLDHGADPDAATVHSQTALIAAASQGSSEIVRLLTAAGAAVNYADGEGYTALRYALQSEHLKTAQLLIDAGADVDWKDNAGYTLLIGTVVAGNLNTARLLLRHGADANLRYLDEVSPLMFASALGHAELADLLVRSGAEIDARTTDGQTALTAAADEGHPEIASLLLEAAPNATPESLAGTRALLVALQNGHTDVSDLLWGWMREWATSKNESTYLPYRIDEHAVYRIHDLLLQEDLPPATYTLRLDDDPDISREVTYIRLGIRELENAAQDFLESCRQGSAALASVYGGDMILIGPHLTTLLNRCGALSGLQHKIVALHLQTGTPGVLIMCAVQDDSVPTAVNLVRNLVYAGGEVTVRKLNDQELDWYWSCISWDIEEPVFVLENAEHRVLIDFAEDGTIFYVELLDNLEWTPVWSER